MASEHDIAEGFFERLAAFAAAQSPALTVAWPNINFDTPASGGYLRPTFLPAQTFSFGLASGSSNQYRGIFQVDVFWPENDGLPNALEVADAVKDWFPKFSTFTRNGLLVKISEAPWLSGLLQEPKWIQVPVSVPYFVGEP